MHEKEGCNLLTSLRRHYPDQVCGYYLSDPSKWQVHPGYKLIAAQRYKKIIYEKM